MGSAPKTIEVPKAAFPGRAAVRPVPRLAPTTGGVWITNSDTTIQFVRDDGTVDPPVEVGAAPTR